MGGALTLSCQASNRLVHWATQAWQRVCHWPNYPLPLNVAAEGGLRA
jgi:hypothetical protein